MANIPNSSRYRSTGTKTSASAGAARRTRPAHNNSSAQGRAVQPPSGLGWVWGVVALGLLIALPYYVLGIVGVVLVIAWFLGMKK